MKTNELFFLLIYYLHLVSRLRYMDALVRNEFFIGEFLNRNKLHSGSQCGSIKLQENIIPVINKAIEVGSKEESGYPFNDAGLFSHSEDIFSGIKGSVGIIGQISN